MKAVILVGGKATRLLPLTCNTPKSMVPVRNKPFMEYVIRHLARHQIGEIIMAVSHLPEPIKDYFKDGRNFGCRISYVLEDEPLGTAGAIRNALDRPDGPFLVLNGDIFTDLDLTAMIRFHREKKAQTTIVLTPVANPSAYGLVETDSQGRVTRFLEKPSPEQITTNMINAGTYVLEPEILDRIPLKTNVSIERRVFPGLVASGQPVYGYPSDSYWIDIGTPAKYFKLNQDLLGGNNSEGDSDKETEISSGANCRIHETAHFKGPVLIGNGCQIGPRAVIHGPVVIGHDCIIKEDAIVEESIIWQKTEIGAGAKLKKSIIANDCLLENRSVVEESVLGNNIVIGNDLKLGRGSKIWAGTVIKTPL